jgi:hypothetical protein
MVDNFDYVMVFFTAVNQCTAVLKQDPCWREGSTQSLGIQATLQDTHRWMSFNPISVLSLHSTQPMFLEFNARRD